MMGRRQFGIAGLSALGLAAMQRSTLAAEHGAHDEAMQSCAKECSECERECSSCASHCASMLADGKKAHAATLATCQDCADVCGAAAQIVARGGPFAALICQACADACSRCAKACQAFPDDKHMKMCADECLKCEKACREMVKHAAM